MTEEATDDVVTVSAACRVLGVTPQTIYKLIKGEKVKAFKLPGRTSPYRIYKKSLDDYVGILSTSSPFVRILRETFPEDSLHLEVLELRFRDGLDDDSICSKALAPAVKEGLAYKDVKDDKFALRIIAQLYLAEEE
jgi:excisionase family DNA binding protein